MVDASTGTEKWTSHYARPLKDIFAVQDEIVGKVVTTLGLLFKLEEMRLPHGGPSYRTQNPEAYDDFLRTLSFFSLQSGRQLKSQALGRTIDRTGP